MSISGTGDNDLGLTGTRPNHQEVNVGDNTLGVWGKRTLLVRCSQGNADVEHACL